MLKKIFKIIKKFILSIFLLYGYNLIGQSLGMIIPINIYTVLLITFFGLPALLALIFILAVLF